MQGDPVILDALNLCLKDQLTAINQLFLHARISKNWGLDEFNEHEFKRSIKAMKMADAIIDRILFLEGLPNLQDLGKLLIGEDIPEILGGDLQMQLDIRSNLLSGIKDSEDAKDYISRDCLKKVLKEAESHIDWVEAQQWLIEQAGIENYLQTQM